MKNKITFYLGLLTFTMITTSAHSQELCMVTADSTTGQNYVLYWQQPADISNLDSVIIYRQNVVVAGFFRIGAVAVGPTLPTHFADSNANTIAFSRYKIAFKDTNNAEVSLSKWHQPVVYDYSGTVNGQWLWTQYEVEDQVDESYISEYRCLVDMDGMGLYSLLGTAANTQNSWLEPNWVSHPAWHYVMETILPGCSYINKANINTSRSNIKQQFTNAEAGIIESSLKGVQFDILNNPVSDNLTVVFGSEQKDATVWISATNGTQFGKSKLTGTEYTSSTSLLSQGVYFFNVEVNGVISTKRFIKK